MVLEFCKIKSKQFEKELSSGHSAQGGTKILEGMLILVPWVGPKFYESILVYEY